MNLTYSVHSLLASAGHLLAKTGTTASTTKTSGSSPTVLILLVVVFGVLYFFVVRPSSRRRMQAMRQVAAYQVGDEVIAGGMVGRVVRVGDGEVDIDAGDGVFTFVPSAVQSRAAYNASRARAAGARGGFGAGAGAGRFPAGSSSSPPVPGDAEEQELDGDDGDPYLEEGNGSGPAGVEPGNWPAPGTKGAEGGGATSGGQS